MELRQALENLRVVLDVRAQDKRRLLLKLAGIAADHFPWVDRERLFEALWAREQEASTGIGGGVAIPHAAIVDLREPFCLVARLAEPLDYDAMDGQPVSLLFLLASPLSPGKGGLAAATHVRMLARLARLCMRPGFVDRLLEAPDEESVVRAFLEENQRHA